MWRWPTRRGRQLCRETWSHFRWPLGEKTGFSVAPQPAELGGPGLGTAARPAEQGAPGAGGRVSCGSSGEVFAPPPATGSLQDAEREIWRPKALPQPGPVPGPRAEKATSGARYRRGLGYAWRASLLFSSEKENTISFAENGKGFAKQGHFSLPDTQKSASFQNSGKGFFLLILSNIPTRKAENRPTPAPHAACPPPSPAPPAQRGVLGPSEPFSSPEQTPRHPSLPSLNPAPQTTGVQGAAGSTGDNVIIPS